MEDGDGKLVTEMVAVMKVWEGYLEELLNQGGRNSELELPSYSM